MAMHVWGGDIWGISVPSCQFCCKPKTSLKSQKKKKNTQGRHFWHNFCFPFMCVYILYTRSTEFVGHSSQVILANKSTN